jgi:peptidoglycan/xylan/chitin deacetylase (PgdA/CDA1 family)
MRIRAGVPETGGIRRGLMKEAIPVLMYHSIAPQISGWAFSYLSIDPEVFEDHISTLAASGYVGISLGELYDYVSGKGRLPPRAVVMTFDDGYLDNWVFAFPILKRHGFKATVFVSTDFIDRRSWVRPTLDDVWQGRARRGELVWRGFLAEDEMRRLQASELIDIQAHCKSHTWYFVSDRIVDFHHPGDTYPWLAWNARPDRKYLYLEEDQSDFVPFGSPVYDHHKAVVACRYFPDPKIEKDLVEHVRSQGGASFFDRPGWKDELNRLADEIAAHGLKARTETDQEYMTRLTEEITLSKVELEKMLGRELEFLCWPGGSYNEVATKVAREAGFRAMTLSSRDRGPHRNIPGEDPAWIRRTAATPWWAYRGRRVCTVDGAFLKHIIEDYKGYAFAGLRLKWLKASKLLASLFS